MGRPVLLETRRLAVDVAGQQHQPELGRLRFGQVGQLAVGRSRPGEADAQLGHAEQPGQQGADDVHRLNAGQRQPARVLPDQAGLDPQRVPLEAPAGDHPVDVAVDGRDQRDHDEVVGLGVPFSAFEWTVETRKRSTRAGTSRPIRATGVSGWSRRQPSLGRRRVGLASLTCPPPSTRPARSAGPGAGPPRPSPARECGRRWPPPPCAA